MARLLDEAYGFHLRQLLQIVRRQLVELHHAHLAANVAVPAEVDNAVLQPVLRLLHLHNVVD